MGFPQNGVRNWAKEFITSNSGWIVQTKIPSSVETELESYSEKTNNVHRKGGGGGMLQKTSCVKVEN